MPRRRARSEPDSPQRLALAVARHRLALARLDALRAGRPLPEAPPEPLPPSAAPITPSASPEQTYRNTERLLGEGSDQ
ncbi:hypothetical protein AWL63_06310 [Sphingomonas panacis]|uniref:Uncharacterized protein n=1 Tax=Sphingomonas panacis TaxID=1560345 RepID=A0A1B3Z891_9SPHN|nr:hypothetical protein AWL63_06310 [Sphingomonas panacis]